MAFFILKCVPPINIFHFSKVTEICVLWDWLNNVWNNCSHEVTLLAKTGAQDMVKQRVMTIFHTFHQFYLSDNNHHGSSRQAAGKSIQPPEGINVKRRM